MNEIQALKIEQIVTHKFRDWLYVFLKQSVDKDREMLDFENDLN